MVNNQINKDEFQRLNFWTGVGSFHGAVAIVILSTTISIWAEGLGLSPLQIGIISAALTFAIAFGSLITGWLVTKIKLYAIFNWINLVTLIGLMFFVFSKNMVMLFVGAIVVGFTTGIDLPVSLTVASVDTENAKQRTLIIASSQMFWQFGILVSYIGAFLTSKLSGLVGVRLLYTLFSLSVLITLIYRLNSKKLQSLHRPYVSVNKADPIKLTDLFKGKQGKNSFIIFGAITIFYVLWNLLSNTWGQFQTYALVNVGASQTYAVGLGIIVNVIAFIMSFIFSRMASGRYRNLVFMLGILIQFIAMSGVVIVGANAGLAILIFAITLYNFGQPLAGDGMYKVWTQESFPPVYRAKLQGIINGIARLIAGIAAIFTPMLFTPGRIQITMLTFAIAILVAGCAGLIIIKIKNEEIKND